MILDGATVVTMDAGRSEHATGHVVIENGRIAAVGPGRAPAELAGPRTDVTGCLVTPGLVNTHHHLYQWVTRGLAVDDGLFGWLTTLYPVWGCIDEDVVGAAAAAGLAWLARTGCTTSTDHHYVFPADGGDVLGAEIAAARRVGLRFMPTRGSRTGWRDGAAPDTGRGHRTMDATRHHTQRRAGSMCARNRPVIAFSAPGAAAAGRRVARDRSEAEHPLARP